MFRKYLPIEYLCIDVATHYGLDKKTFEERIAFVKQNIANLRDLAYTADEKPLYMKAVMALEDAIDGRPTGHLIALDATCSGISILSAMIGCEKGAAATNLIDTGNREDAYTKITETMNQLLITQGSATTTVSRNEAKDAVMTACYGSKRTPKEIFGEGELLDTFYNACLIEAEGAFSLLNVFLAAWQANALQHTWTMPDGFNVNIKVMQTKESRIEIDELEHTSFSVNYKVNEGTRTGVSLPANITHSVDAYLLRNVVRRCNYDKTQVTKVNKLLKEQLAARQPVTKTQNKALQDAINQFNDHNICDTSIIPLINAQNINKIPAWIMVKLLDITTQMLKHDPFPVLTVHDCFRCHPNHADVMRYWYKEIVAEIAESEMLNAILTSITGVNQAIPKYSSKLPALIRESNLAIC